MLLSLHTDERLETGLLFWFLIMVVVGVVMMRTVVVQRTMVIRVGGMNDNGIERDRSVSGCQDNIFQSVCRTVAGRMRRSSLVFTRNKRQG